jgi:hypothetical protein
MGCSQQYSHGKLGPPWLIKLVPQISALLIFVFEVLLMALERAFGVSADNWL